MLVLAQRDAKQAGRVWLAALVGGLLTLALGLWLQSHAWAGAGHEPAPWKALGPYWLGFGVLWVVLTAGLWRVGRHLDRWRGLGSVAVVLLVALLAKGTVLATAEPVLSDDIYRYLHEGALLADGQNPYGKKPSNIDAQQSPLPSALEKVNHKHLGAIYQPAAQYVFATATHIHNQITATLGMVLDRTTTFRAVMVLFSLLIVVMLAARLREAGRSPWWAALWGLHPLVISEVAGSGHQDVIGIAALLAGLLLFERANRRLSFAAGGSVALAIAVAVKPIAAPVAIPVAWWLRRWPRGLLMTAVVGCIAMVALYLPFVMMPRGIGLLPGSEGQMINAAQRFADAWKFNGSLHPLVADWLTPFGYNEVKWRALDWLEWGDAWVFGGALQFLFADAVTTVCNNLARYVLGAVALLALGLSIWRSEDKLFRPMVVYFLVMMLTTSTLHPWYALWGLALLPLAFDTALWVLAGTVTLSYVAQHHPSDYEVPVALKLVEFVPVYALAALGFLTGLGVNRPGWLPGIKASHAVNKGHGGTRGAETKPTDETAQHDRPRGRADSTRDDLDQTAAALEAFERDENDDGQ